MNMSLSFFLSREYVTSKIFIICFQENFNQDKAYFRTILLEADSTQFQTGPRSFDIIKPQKRTVAPWTSRTHPALTESNQSWTKVKALKMIIKTSDIHQILRGHYDPPLKTYKRRTKKKRSKLFDSKPIISVPLYSLVPWYPLYPMAVFQSHYQSNEQLNISHTQLSIYMLFLDSFIYT